MEKEVVRAFKRWGINENTSKETLKVIYKFEDRYQMNYLLSGNMKMAKKKNNVCKALLDLIEKEA